MAKSTNEPTELPPVFIKERMLAEKITGTALADRMDTTPATVSRLLNGHRKISLEWLYAFAKALGCPPADLLTPPTEGNRKAAKSEPEILSLLASIEGLNDKDIDVAFSVIKMALAKRDEPERAELSGQSELASLHRE